MGGTTTVIATSRIEIKDKIPSIILWVPDPKSTFDGDTEEIGEEGGQLYENKFWQEAHDSNFFKCLNDYNGKTHLVYGETDKYISDELRSQVIDIVKSKSQTVKVLKNQDHSPWEFKLIQEVYKEELELIKLSFI